MAISQGFGPHATWLNCGGQWPIEHGNVAQSAERKTSTFSGVIPMSWPGARSFFASVDNGADASINVMTRGQMSTLITGALDHVEFDYIKRNIHFVGRDKSSKLHEMTTSEKWLNKKPSEIVQDLVARAGIDVGNIAASQVQAGKQLQQDFVKLSENNTFARIIHEMARLDGARWWIDQHGKFNYVLYGNPQGMYSVNIQQDSEPIRSDCVELRVKHNLQAGRPHEVTVKGWHPKKRQIFTGTSNVEGKGPKRSWNYQVPTLTQDKADRHAKSEANEKARHEFTASVTVAGDPSVQAGMGLQVNGTDFDQTLDIDTVHHEFGMSGHITHITARSGKEAA